MCNENIQTNKIKNFTVKNNQLSMIQQKTESGQESSTLSQRTREHLRTESEGGKKLIEYSKDKHPQLEIPQ